MTFTPDSANSDILAVSALPSVITQFSLCAPQTENTESTPKRSAGFGLSVQKSVSVAFWNAVIGSSSAVIGLYPSERFGVDSVFSVCGAQRLNCVITDGRADTARISEFAESGVKVIVADNQE